MMNLEEKFFRVYSADANGYSLAMVGATAEFTVGGATQTYIVKN
jgi:hypothetical protein